MPLPSLHPLSKRVPVLPKQRRKPRRKVRTPLRLENLEDRCLLSFRTYNGLWNNLFHPRWGSAGVDEIRKAPVAYADGISTPARPNDPSARAISNAANNNGNQPLDDVNSNRFLSDYAYVWGQFIDHDIDLTNPGTGAQGVTLNIPVPAGDPQFDPLNTGTAFIPFTRSEFDPRTGTGVLNPRQHPNDITAFIDGSMIYGSDATRAFLLRSHMGGHLKTSPGSLLPFNNSTYFGAAAPLANANDAGIYPESQMFVAGDVRANENIELTNIHTLFLREHNRIADIYHSLYPYWDDEMLYQMARRWVGAEIQVITYNEWIPAVLGASALAPYTGYEADVNPGIANEFATASFRLGHSMLSEGIDRFDNNGNQLPGRHGNIQLRDAFFNPTYLNTSTDPANTVGDDVDAIAKGNASDLSQEIDLRVIDDVRNFLFTGPPHPFGLDLPAINMQRGRDHGLPDYNTLRAAYGLPRVHSYADISKNSDTQARLLAAYGKTATGQDNVDQIDPWLGGLAEDHIPGTSTGPLIHAVLVDQFTRLRDGDRFFYLNDFNFIEKLLVSQTTLAEVIENNTHITNLQDNVFFFKLSIGGQVFQDQDVDIVPDFDEVPLPGVTVQLEDAVGNVLSTAVTDANGHYEFTNFDGLAVGTFRVREVAPAGFVQNTANPADITFTRGNIDVDGINFGNARVSGAFAASPNGSSGPVFLADQFLDTPTSASESTSGALVNQPLAPANEATPVAEPSGVTQAAQPPSTGSVTSDLLVNSGNSDGQALVDIVATDQVFAPL